MYLSFNALQLKWNWRDCETIFFLILCMWNRKFSEVAILAPNICSTSLCAWGVMVSFEEEICTFQYAPQFNWNWRAYKRTFFSMVLNFMGIGTFQKQPFWGQTFFLYACMYMESLAVLMRKFVHFDMVHS